MSEELIKVLFVDDEPNNLTSFSASFRRKYKIFTALSAKEGNDILAVNEIPIIIADNRMPEVSGVEFLTNVKTSFPNTIRIILTGYSDIETVIDSINLGGVSFYMFKPWDIEELEKCIEQGYALYKSNKDKEYKIDNLLHEVQELKQKMNYEFEHYTIVIRDNLVTAIKQYLMFFKDFVLQSKNKKIHFEVRTVETGIEIELNKNESKEEIQNYLNEYIGFLKLGHASPNPIMSDNNEIKKEILIARLNSEIRHLQNSLDLEKIKNSIMSENIDKFYNLLKNPNPNTFHFNFQVEASVKNKTVEKTVTISKPSTQNNPWVSGTFYLFSIVVILSTLLIVFKISPSFGLPFLILSSFITFILIGAFQLRNDQSLSDKSFLQLVAITFQYLPRMIHRKK